MKAVFYINLIFGILLLLLIILTGLAFMGVESLHWLLETPKWR